MALDPTQVYESLFEDSDRVSVPRRIVARNIGLEQHYITFPLFSLPKKQKRENSFSHPFVNGSLPAQQTIINLQEKDSIAGFSFKNASLTYVDPIFVSPFGKEMKPVLSLSDQSIRYKDMKETAKANIELLNFYQERTKDEKDVHFHQYNQEMENLVKKRNKLDKEIQDFINENSVRLTSMPLLTNHMRIGINKVPLINVKYFIIETESGTKTPPQRIYMTQELFVESGVGGPFFEQQFRHLIFDKENILQPQNIVRVVQTEDGINLVNPIWKRTKLFKYEKAIPSLNLTGTFILDKRFIPVNTVENEQELYNFEIYLAYSTEQSGLVWRNPETQKLTPITILVATSLIGERINDLNSLEESLVKEEFLNPNPNWSDTFYIGNLSLVNLIKETAQKEEFQSLETITKDLIKEQKYVNTAISLPRLGIKKDQKNPSPLALLINSIRKEMEPRYTFNQNEIEKRNIGHGFSLETITTEKIYSYETIVMAYEELITNGFVKLIQPRRKVLGMTSLIGEYNSYNIETTLIAKLDTEYGKTKHFTDGNTTFGTKNFNVDKLFSKGQMYFLVMKNKAALILVRHSNPVGIVLQLADQVQILNVTEYERGKAFEIVKNGQLSSFLEEGAILIDPHFQWNGEFAFISKTTLNSAKQYLNQKKVPLTQENLISAIANVRKNSPDSYKIAVVQEIYLAKFYMDTPSEIGKIRGGLKSEFAQAFK